MFRDTASCLGLPDEHVYDGVTMASELAANTLYAQENIPFEGAPACPWLAPRNCGSTCAVRWPVGTGLQGVRFAVGLEIRLAARAGRARPGAVGGRGLQVVAGLSGGRWGHHLTRSRLGGWKVPGKAVWFALPVHPGWVPARLSGPGRDPAMCPSGWRRC